MSAEQAGKEGDSHDDETPALAGQQSSDPSSSSASPSGASESSEKVKLGTHANALLRNQEQEAKVAGPDIQRSSSDRSAVDVTADNIKDNVAAPQVGVANQSLRDKSGAASLSLDSLAAVAAIPEEDELKQPNTGESGGVEAPSAPSDPVVSHLVDGCARLEDENKKRKENLETLRNIGLLFPQQSEIRGSITTRFDTYKQNEYASHLREEVRNIVTEVSVFSKTLQDRESRIADVMGHCNALSEDLKEFYASASTNAATSAQLFHVGSVINVGGSCVKVDEETNRVLTGDSHFVFLNDIFTSKLDTDDHGRVFLDMSADAFKAMIRHCNAASMPKAASRRPKKPKLEPSISKDRSLGSVIASYYIAAVQNEAPMCPMTFDQLIHNVLPGGDGGEFPVSLTFPDDNVQARLMKQLPGLGHPLTTTSLLYQGDPSELECSEFCRLLRGATNTLLFILDVDANLVVMYNEQEVTDLPVGDWSDTKQYYEGKDNAAVSNNFAVIRQSSESESSAMKKKEGQNVGGDTEPAYFTMTPSDPNKAVQLPWFVRPEDKPVPKKGFAMPFNFGSCALQLRFGHREAGGRFHHTCIYQNVRDCPYWTTDADTSDPKRDAEKQPDAEKHPRKTILAVRYMVAIRVNIAPEQLLKNPSSRLHSILNTARRRIDVYLDYCPTFQEEGHDRTKGHDDVSASALSMSKDCPTLEQSKGLRSLKTKCQYIYKEQEIMLRDALKASLARVRHCFMARHFSFYPKGKLVRITTHSNSDPIVTRLDTLAMFIDSKFSRQVFWSEESLEMSVTNSLDMDNHDQFRQQMSTELDVKNIKLNPNILRSLIPGLYSKEHIKNHSQETVTKILDSEVRSTLDDCYAIPHVLADAKIISDHLDDIRNRSRWIDVDMTHLFATHGLKRRALEIVIDHMRLARMCQSGLIPRPRNVVDIVTNDIIESECQVGDVVEVLEKLGIEPDRY